MLDSDLKRSYYQYLKHIKVDLVQLNFVHRWSLSFIFIVIFLSSLVFSFIYYRKKAGKRINSMICSSDREPYDSIKNGLLKNDVVELAKINRFAPPVLPMMFYVEVFKNFRFYMKRMDFLGAMSIKLVQYFSLYHKKNMRVLIVLQEYSFYMSYLTALVEARDGKLFNIMHGIPGEEASFFRFSKCFVWGTYYKNFFIRNFAEKRQFVVSGSIYHTALKSRIEHNIQKKYDIVYLMQGNRFATSDEVSDVLKILSQLSRQYKVAVKQHPLHYVKLDYNIEEIEIKNVFDVYQNCKIVLSHFSTSLLDAKLLGINAVSYSKINRESMLGFMEEDEIMHNEGELLNCLKNRLEKGYEAKPLSADYIDTSVDTVSLIKNEIEKR